MTNDTHATDGPRRYQYERTLSRIGRTTRNKLLAALEERLGDEALHRVTITSIARKANASNATFYQYFPTLEKGMEGLLDSYVQYIGAQMDKAAPTLVEGDMFLVSAVSATDPSIPVEDVLTQRVTEILEFIESHRAALAATHYLATCGQKWASKALDGVLGALGDSLDRVLGLSLVGVAGDDTHARLALWQLLSVGTRFDSVPWSEYTDLADAVIESVTDTLMELKENEE